MNVNDKPSATEKDCECEPPQNGSHSDEAATSSGGLRLEVKVDVTDSNPILDFADFYFDSDLKVLHVKHDSALKSCCVRLARMNRK